METILGAFMGLFLIFIIVIIVIYVALAIFLSKLNKLMYGKGTALAWIPICNIYLLGKLTVNKTVGWILVACSILTANTTTTINGVTTTHSILPGALNSIVSILYRLGIIGLFVYAIVKYVRLKNGNVINNQQNESMQPSYNTLGTVSNQNSQSSFDMNSQLMQPLIDNSKDPNAQLNDQNSNMQ